MTIKEITDIPFSQAKEEFNAVKMNEIGVGPIKNYVKYKNIIELEKVIRPGQKLSNIKDMRHYYNLYFIVLRKPDVVIFWDAEAKRTKWYTINEFKKTFFSIPRVAIKWKVPLLSIIPVIDEKVDIYNHIISGRKFFPVVKTDKPLLYSRGRKNYINLFNQEHFEKKLNTISCTNDEVNVEFLLEWFDKVCSCNITKFIEIFNMMVNTNSLTKNDKVINFYGSCEILSMINFFAFNVIGSKNTIYDTNFDNFLQKKCITMYGKILGVVDNETNYSHFNNNIIKTHLKNITELDHLKYDIQNISSVIVITPHKPFFTKKDTDFSVTIDVTGYEFPYKLKQYIKDRDVGRMTKLFFQKLHVIPVKNGKSYGRSYQTFVDFLNMTESELLKIHGFLDFHTAFVIFYPDIIDLDVELLLKVFHKFRLTQNKYREKEKQIRNDILPLTNLMIMKHILMKNKLSILLQCLRDIFLLKGKDIKNMRLKELTYIVKIYSNVICSHTKYIGGQYIRLTLQKLFGRESFTYTNLYRVTITYKQLKKKFEEESWLTPFDIFSFGKSQ